MFLLHRSMDRFHNRLRACDCVVMDSALKLRHTSLFPLGIKCDFNHCRIESLLICLVAF